MVEALDTARFPDRGIFLELFAGSARITRSLRKAGFAVVALDILDINGFDLCQKELISFICRLIEHHIIVGVWLGTLCTTWSSARYPPIRSRSSIWGLSGLKPQDVEKVSVGNATARVTARILRCCVGSRVPAILENPDLSMLWSCPPIAALLRGEACRTQRLCFCAFGARWRKATRLAGWFVDMSPLDNHMCRGRHGICEYSGVHHIVLKGRDPISKRPWTSLACPYPMRSADRASQALILASRSYSLM